MAMGVAKGLAAGAAERAQRAAGAERGWAWPAVMLAGCVAAVDEAAVLGAVAWVAADVALVGAVGRALARAEVQWVARAEAVRAEVETA